MNVHRIHAVLEKILLKVFKNFMKIPLIVYTTFNDYCLHWKQSKRIQFALAAASLAAPPTHPCYAAENWMEKGFDSTEEEISLIAEGATGSIPASLRSVGYKDLCYATVAIIDDISKLATNMVTVGPTNASCRFTPSRIMERISQVETDVPDLWVEIYPRKVEHWITGVTTFKKSTQAEFWSTFYTGRNNTTNISRSSSTICSNVHEKPEENISLDTAVDVIAENIPNSQNERAISKCLIETASNVNQDGTTVEEPWHYDNSPDEHQTPGPSRPYEWATNWNENCLEVISNNSHSSVQRLNELPEVAQCLAFIEIIQQEADISLHEQSERGEIRTSRTKLSLRKRLRRWFIRLSCVTCRNSTEKL